MDIEFLRAGLAVALIKAYPKHFQFTELSLKQDQYLCGPRFHPIVLVTRMSNVVTYVFSSRASPLNKCGNNIRLFAARIHAIAEELDGTGANLPTTAASTGELTPNRSRV
jgi:hypothetical protein